MSHDFCLPEDIEGVADCLDNFESRFSLWKSLPDGLFFVHSGVEQFFGQVLSLIKGRSIDFLNIFENYDNRERIIPVSANVVSVVSSLASTEVLNHLFHEPQLLDNLLIIDLSDFTLKRVTLV
jgi:molybdopterin/thiamine biosynthesis adenylyltransferase